jgi:hypothetical protein
MNPKSAMILVSVAAVGLILGGLFSRWWSSTDHDLSMGLKLTSAELCDGTKCEESSYDKVFRGEVPTRTKFWVAVGRGTFWGGFVVVALVAITLALALGANSATMSIARISTGLSGALLVAAIIFCLAHPEWDRGETPSIAVGLFLTTFGAFAAVAGGVLALRNVSASA